MQKSLETALQKISSKLLITDKDLKVLFINSSAEDFLNTTSKKCEGKLIHDVFIEKPTNNLELLDLLEKKTYLKRHITTLFLEGGLKKKCSFVAYYLGEESESIVFEFFDAEKQILEKKARRKSTGGVITAAFSKGLAHEIKNPLSGIKGAAQLLSNKLKTKENQELLDIISRESDRITNIVNQVSEKQFQLSLAKENIHVVLEKLPDFISSLDSRDIKFIRDYDPSLPLVNIDSSLIMQVFYNLTRNSIEAMIKAKVGTKITVRTRVASEVIINGSFFKTACEIDFIDNGPGIPEEYIDSIFFPLVSTKKVASGLGLAIAKGIINQHHGSIECSSDSSGTNFSILIPFPEEIFEEENAEVLNV